MKSCPRCGNTYPDAERFCDSDGIALVPAAGAAGRGTTVMPDDVQGTAAGALIVCPECHGEAEPGEAICNFCGTRLQPDAATPGASAASTAQRTPADSSRSAVTPEDFIPSRGRLGGSEIGVEPPYDEAPIEEPSLRERIARVLGYSLAAIIAIAAGGWFALHLSSGRTNAPVPVAITSPANNSINAPTVALARNLQIEVKGADLAAALHRDLDSVRKVFDANRDTVLDTYKRALESDNTLHDGMIVRLHVSPDGSVGGGSVVISTSPNPSLDAEVVKSMSNWKFAAAGTAPVDVDYPLVFATSSSDIGGIEADLRGKVASRGPNEMPEYASAPPVAPSPPVAVATPEAAPPPPAIAALPPPEAPAMKPHHRRHASLPPPPSITERVMESLAADKRLRRVQAYASGGGMVTITGKVFDDNVKALAERTVRHVNGVSGVIDNLTTDTSVWAQNESLINQRLQTEGLTGVTARVIGNGAYLDGTVKTDLDRERAETVAVSAAPVKVRTNLIKVDPGFFGF